MSENSDSGSDDARITNGKAGDDDVCRDFMRNVCRRGKRCKYSHPNSGGAGGENSSDMGSSSKPEPTFCHDFQNTGCHRPTCKFLHCTREEEEHFHQTGQLPQRLHQNGPQSGNSSNNNNNHSDIPVCRDYMKGECKRGAKCKYRHLNNDFHHHDGDSCSASSRNDGHGGVGRPDLGHRPHDLRGDLRGPHHPNDQRPSHNHHGSFNNFDDHFDKFDRFEYSHSGPDGPQLKRRRVDMDGYNGNAGSGGSNSGSYESRYGLGGPSLRPVSYQYQVLEEENTALRRRVEDLKKQVADLTATNEVLLEQNARMRVSKSAAVNAVHMQASQALGPPPVTLSLAAMGQAATLQASALSAHLNPNLSQQIALNSDMATQHALQSAAHRMAREIQQQQQQQHQASQNNRVQGGPQNPNMGVPLTLNPTVTLNPSLASLSLPQNNLVAVSLPSLVSSLQGVGHPGCSMAQNFCPPSNPLVSYPIMSQDMRCAVAPSSMAH